jgi:Icc protein
MPARRRYVIAQLSDIHCGDPRFDEGLARGCVDGVNDAKPDLVVVPGDLTMAGYPDEYEAARALLDRIECTNLIVVPGNHDERNVGWKLFERYIGPRWQATDVPFEVEHRGVLQKRMRVVAADSGKPDLNEGEIGRMRYDWIREKFDGSVAEFKVFVLHHHLIGVPGTGRERNIVWDAGDALELLIELKVDLVIAGHKHVPYTWDLNGMPIVTSGTATTRRTRDDTPPSYNLITISPEQIAVTVCDSGDPEKRVERFRRNR